MRTTAELDRRTAPARVRKVLGHLFDVKFDGDHTHRIRVRLTKDSTKTWDLLGFFQQHVFAVHIHIALNKVVAHLFDLRELSHVHRCLVRKVEAQLGRSHERALLVDMITQNLTQTKVEDVCASVVVAQRTTTRLVVVHHHLVIHT